jgi:hypothetical protein
MKGFYISLELIKMLMAAHCDKPCVYKILQIRNDLPTGRHEKGNGNEEQTK